MPVKRKRKTKVRRVSRNPKIVMTRRMTEAATMKRAQRTADRTGKVVKIYLGGALHSEVFPRKIKNPKTPLLFRSKVAAKKYATSHGLKRYSITKVKKAK